MIDFSGWTAATGTLDWGTQRVMRDTLALVSEGKIELVHGADSLGGKPCLVNAVASMIAHDVSRVNPASWYPAVVSAFDRINRALMANDVNAGDGFVSPLAAEVLLANFAPLKPVPTEADFAKAAAEVMVASTVYVEPTDEEVTTAWDAAPSFDSHVESALRVTSS